MRRQNLLSLVIACTVIFLACFTFTVLAQDAVAPTATTAGGVTPVTPTIDPFSAEDFDLLAILGMMIDLYRAGWYLLVAAIFYLLVLLVRGKLKIGGWLVKIPKFSDWLDGHGSAWKSWFVVGFCGIGSAFGALAAVDEWKFGLVAKVMFGGLIAGIQLALSAMGTNNLVSNTVEAIKTKNGNSEPVVK